MEDCWRGDDPYCPSQELVMKWVTRERPKIDNPALKQMATIVRGADTSRLDLAPESPGLYALSLGLSRNFQDDHEMLAHGLVMYDALYAWCKHCEGEEHRWPPKT